MTFPDSLQTFQTTQPNTQRVMKPPSVPVLNTNHPIRPHCQPAVNVPPSRSPMGMFTSLSFERCWSDVTSEHGAATASTHIPRTGHIVPTKPRLNEPRNRTHLLYTSRQASSPTQLSTAGFCPPTSYYRRHISTVSLSGLAILVRQLRLTPDPASSSLSPRREVAGRYTSNYTLTVPSLRPQSPAPSTPRPSQYRLPILHRSVNEIPRYHDCRDGAATRTRANAEYVLSQARRALCSPRSPGVHSRPSRVPTRLVIPAGSVMDCQVEGWLPSRFPRLKPVFVRRHLDSSRLRSETAAGDDTLGHPVSPELHCSSFPGGASSGSGASPSVQRSSRRVRAAFGHFCPMIDAPPLSSLFGTNSGPSCERVNPTDQTRLDAGRRQCTMLDGVLDGLPPVHLAREGGAVILRTHRPVPSNPSSPAPGRPIRVERTRLRHPAAGASAGPTRESHSKPARPTRPHADSEIAFPATASLAFSAGFRTSGERRETGRGRRGEVQGPWNAALAGGTGRDARAVSLAFLRSAGVARGSSEFDYAASTRCSVVLGGTQRGRASGSSPASECPSVVVVYCGRAGTCISESVASVPALTYLGQILAMVRGGATSGRSPAPSVLRPSACWYLCRIKRVSGYIPHQSGGTLTLRPPDVLLIVPSRLSTSERSEPFADADGTTLTCVERQSIPFGPARIAPAAAASHRYRAYLLLPACQRRVCGKRRNTDLRSPVSPDGESRPPYACTRPSVPSAPVPPRSREWPLASLKPCPAYLPRLEMFRGGGRLLALRPRMAFCASGRARIRNRRGVILLICDSWRGSRNSITSRLGAREHGGDERDRGILVGDRGDGASAGGTLLGRDALRGEIVRYDGEARRAGGEILWGTRGNRTEARNLREDEHEIAECSCALVLAAVWRGRGGDIVERRGSWGERGRRRSKTGGEWLQSGCKRRMRLGRTRSKTIPRATTTNERAAPR
ncbi:hypothetical protein V8D89_008788 [Ganoderma adspersum]